MTIIDNEDDYYGTIDRVMAVLSSCVACGKVPRPWMYGHWFIQCCRFGNSSKRLTDCITKWERKNSAVDWAEASVISGDAT